MERARKHEGMATLEGHVHSEVRILVVIAI